MSSIWSKPYFFLVFSNALFSSSESAPGVMLLRAFDILLNSIERFLSIWKEGTKEIKKCWQFYKKLSCIVKKNTINKINVKKLPSLKVIQFYILLGNFLWNLDFEEGALDI